MKQKIIFSFPHTPNVEAAAASSYDVIRDPTSLMSSSRIVELAIEHMPTALLIGMGQKLGAQEIAQLPSSVKVVATSSVGFDHLDVVSFKARGIWVTNTPDVLTAATADLTMLLLLGACRRVRDFIAIVDRGWGIKFGQGENLGIDPGGKKLGILGMGRIGQAVAKRARGFGMEILYCNRKPLPNDQEHGAKYFANFHEMLPHCDFLSLHAPGTSETAKIMGAREFALLPKDAIFLNVARGSMVDEDALIASLESKHLFAAGLDVCLNEPNPDPRLIKLPNVLLTPHVGSATRETRDAMGLRALENIRVALAGEKPRDNLY